MCGRGAIRDARTCLSFVVDGATGRLMGPCMSREMGGAQVPKDRQESQG